MYKWRNLNNERHETYSYFIMETIQKSLCANCSGSFSWDSLIFLNISSKVLPLNLGLEPDIFTLQANSPTVDGQWQTSKCINSFLDSDVKSVWKTNCVLFYVKTKPLKIKWTVNFKELIKVTVLIANVYLSTCGSLSLVQ